jgi:hypothetical protein
MSSLSRYSKAQSYCVNYSSSSAELKEIAAVRVTEERRVIKNSISINLNISQGINEL